MHQIREFAFGQHSAIYQLISVVAVAITATLVVLLRDQSLWITVPLGLTILFWAMFYAFPGHALVYGPFLWLYLLAYIFGIIRDDEK